MKHFTFFFCLLILFTFVISCATTPASTPGYEDQLLYEDNLSLDNASQLRIGPFMIVRSIDGKPITVNAYEIINLPSGLHTIVFDFSRKNPRNNSTLYSNGVTIEWDFIADKYYSLSAPENGSVVIPQIKEFGEASWKLPILENPELTPDETVLTLKFTGSTDWELYFKSLEIYIDNKPLVSLGLNRIINIKIPDGKHQISAIAEFDNFYFHGGSMGLLHPESGITEIEANSNHITLAIKPPAFAGRMKFVQE